MRSCTERTFTTHDGVELFYRHWAATGSRTRGAILLFHRGHEHGARIAHLVDELDLPDFAFYAWDAALKAGDPRSIGALSYLTPLLSTGLLVLAGGKEFSARAGLALVLIVGGALAGTLGGGRPSRGPGRGKR